MFRVLAPNRVFLSQPVFTVGVMDEPRELLEEQNVTVIELDDMPVDGAYYPEAQAVALRSGLTRIRERSVLAEELAHHELGHWPAASLREWARMELRAQRRASVAMITLDALADAVAQAGTWQDVADRLDVDPYLLRRRLRDLTDPERAWLRHRLAAAVELGI